MPIEFGYNQAMNRVLPFRKFSEHTIIIISLLSMIFLPRILAGGWYLRQAHSLAGQGSYEQASIHYEDAARRLWWRSGLLELAAYSAWQAGEIHAAQDLYEIAREKDALSSNGKLILGDIYASYGDTQAAMAAWESIGMSTPDSAAAFSRLAASERELGQIEKAMHHWQTVLEIEPQNGKAHFNLGLLLMTIQPLKALPELMLSARIDPELDEQVQVLRTGLNQASLVEIDAYRLVLSGRSLASIGAWDLAKHAFYQASLADPLFSEAWAWQGEASQHLDQDGLPFILKALELDRNSIMSLALAGLYYRRQGLIDQAWSPYVRVATLDSQNSAWQEVLGELSAQKGDLLDALEYYLKAVELAPQDPSAWRTLALFCVQYNVNYNTIGFEAAQKALKLEPDNWRSQDVMGQIMMAKEDPVSARLYFFSSIEIAPDQPDTYLHLGYLDLLQDKRDSAYNNLVNARRLDPQGSIGWQAQRLLDQYFP